jgi:hypothetical protein
MIVLGTCLEIPRFPRGTLIYWAPIKDRVLASAAQAIQE